MEPDDDFLQKKKKKSDEEAKETQNRSSHSAHTIFSLFIVLHLSLRLTLVRSLKEKYDLILPQFPSPNFSTPFFSLFDSSSVHNCNTKSTCVTKRSTAVSHWPHRKLLQIKSQTLRCTTGVDITQIKQTPRQQWQEKKQERWFHPLETERRMEVLHSVTSGCYTHFPLYARACVVACGVRT